MAPHDLVRALRIADEAAISDIETGAYVVKLAGVTWYDVRPMLDAREHSAEVIDLGAIALDHAIARGLAVRHTSVAYLVRIVPQGAIPAPPLPGCRPGAHLPTCGTLGCGGCSA